MPITIRLQPGALAKATEEELRREGTPIILSLSSYDVPKSMKIDREPSGRLHIQFEYLDEESAVDNAVDDELTVQLGKHSGKVLGFLVSGRIRKPREVTVRIVSGVDRELARPRMKDNQRMNYQLIRRVVSTTMENALANTAL